MLTLLMLLATFTTANAETHFAELGRRFDAAGPSSIEQQGRFFQVAAMVKTHRTTPNRPCWPPRRAPGLGHISRQEVRPLRR